MIQSKLIRSTLSNRKSSLNNKFIPLISIQKDTIYVQQRGIQVLKRLTNGSLIIVAFQEEETEIIYRMFESNDNNNKIGTGIWISQNYIQDNDLGHKIIALLSYGNTLQDKIKIHLLNSFIASSIVINIKSVNLSSSHLKYIKQISSHLIYSSLSNNDNYYNLSKQLANLIILQRKSNAKTDFINNKNKLDGLIRQLSMDDSIYRSMNLFQFINDDDIKYNNSVIEELELKIIQLNITYPKQSKKLQYGPVIAEFIQKIVSQYNNTSRHIINYTDCLNKIQIDQSYQAYMYALQHYNQSIKHRFISNQPISNPQPQLFQYKQSSIQQYKKITKDPEYLLDLNNIIQQKQQKILQINDTLWRQRNIDILKKQSKKLMMYNQYKDDPNFDVKKQIERVVNIYERNAGGRTKQQDLNGYLEKLNETLGEDNQYKGIKINKLEREKRLLQERIRKLEKKGCCSDCNLM